MGIYGKSNYSALALFEYEWAGQKEQFEIEMTDISLGRYLPAVTPRV